MSESLKDAFEDCPLDPASDIAVLVMMLEWARGADADDHCHRYGEIQELADPVIKAALASAEAAAHAKGRAEGIGEAVDAAEFHAGVSAVALRQPVSDEDAERVRTVTVDALLSHLRALLPTTGGSDD